MNQPENNDFQLLVSNGVSFLQSMAEVYGSEQAQAAWQAMGPAIGDEVKNAVFMYMLSYPDGGRQVRFQHTPISEASFIVAIIKAIRNASGLGLKEAKDLSDLAKTGIATVTTVRPEAAKALRKDLRDFGARVI